MLLSSSRTTHFELHVLLFLSAQREKMLVLPLKLDPEATAYGAVGLLFFANFRAAAGLRSSLSARWNTAAAYCDAIAVPRVKLFHGMEFWELNLKNCYSILDAN